MEATTGSDEQEILPPLFLAEESQIQEETQSEPSTPSEVLKETLKQSADVIELNSKLEIEKKRRAKVRNTSGCHPSLLHYSQLP